MSGLSAAREHMQKETLLSNLHYKYEKIERKMPIDGGVLVQMAYQVAEVDDGWEIQLDHGNIVGSGRTYKNIIKKLMTGPFVIEKPSSLHQWRFIFIWVTKST